jgi:MFS family permease
MRRAALAFVVLLGIVSLFADMTYEGARSAAGPYLAVLGASATVVGIVAGAGELIGYGLRLVSGYLSDRTGRYWLITIAGYVVNLAAVPILALAGNWETAAGLLVTERIGKAIRTPARDAMLSHATHQVGHGWGFGLHEALDQVGAVLGPLLIGCVLFVNHDYRLAFGLLAVPAGLAMATLFAARVRYPRPADLEPVSPKPEPKQFPRAFWWYVVAVSLAAAGFADFPLIAYHLKKSGIASDAVIPLLYAVAMGVDAAAALLLGTLFDRYGLKVLAVVTAVSSLFAPLVFLAGFDLALAGIAIWGVGMGAQESIARAAIAGLIPKERRGSAYGVFNLCYGAAWFAGSAVIGLLYDTNITGVVVFSLATQLASVPLLLSLGRQSFAAKPPVANPDDSPPEPPAADSP